MSERTRAAVILEQKRLELVGRFIRRSLDDAARLLDRLSAGTPVIGADLESLRYAAHRINGTGATLGFDRVSDAAKELETALSPDRTHDEAQLRRLAVRLLDRLHHLAQDHELPATREPVSAPTPTQLTVLLADDDPEIREIAQAALGLNPRLSVHACESGQRLLDLASRIVPDIVVLDAMMPELDGPATLLKLQEDPRLASVPVIFMTANVMPTETARYRTLGALGVITKPFDPMRLADNVLAYVQPAAKLGAPVAIDKSGDESRLHWLLKSVLEVQRLVTEPEFDLDAFMQRVVDLAASLTAAKGAVIELVDGDDMVYRCTSASIREHVGRRLKRAMSLSGLCVEQAQTLRCDDSETDPRVDKGACRKAGVRSMLCTPLFEAGRAVGVLKVMGTAPEAFDADAQYLLSLLAGALGAALGRQLALQELRTSEEIFRTAMETAPIGHALVKTDGRFLKVNAALCELLGYDEAELLGTDFQSITHPDDLEHDLQQMRQTLAGEIDRYRMEKRYYHKSGRVISALLSVALVRDRGGQPRYFVAQIQDITEQREMERVKNEFISVVSHELRTPLTSIRGSLGLVLGAHAGALSPPVKRFLDIASGNCERLIQLINDILDIDKVASGNMRFDIAPVVVADVLHKAMQATEAYAARFNVKFALDAPDSDSSIEVDESRLLQVLSNLLSNAAKFSPANDVVTVGAHVRSGTVRLSVADRGPGIPENFRDRIFGRFSQADSSATRAAGGTGLGLHISRQIVDRMGGRIGFDTEVGRGTVFWVDFPLAG